MKSDRPPESAQAVLERLGIAVPSSDLPFLQRTLERQRDLLAAMRAQLPADTEPAHVFRVVAEGSR